MHLCCVRIALAVFSTLAVVAGVVQGQTVTATVKTGIIPVAVAVNPVTNKLYVANTGSSNVTVIDGSNNTTATVSAGTNPQAVAGNPETNKVYVAKFSSNNVNVIEVDNS